MFLRRSTGKSEHRASDLAIPVRTSQPYKSRYQIHPIRRLHPHRVLLAVFGIPEHAEAVAQPLNRRASHKNTAFKRILHLAIDTPRNGCDQPMLRHYRLCACIHQHEAAGSVGGFDHALLIARLTEQGRLLVSRRSCDRHLLAEEMIIHGMAIHLG
ncbi:hypothetical protein D3C81_704870 [compost metagenome]